MEFTVIIRIVCVALAYKIKLKCRHNNEAYSAVHKTYIKVIQYTTKQRTTLVNISPSPVEVSKHDHFSDTV
jgi:hypothetical protein